MSKSAPRSRLRLYGHIKRPGTSRDSRCARSTRLQRVLNANDDEPFKQLLLEFESLPAFQKILRSWELEERARPWRNVFIKVPRNNRYNPERHDHIEQYQQHLRKFDYEQKEQKKTKIEQQRRVRERIISDFEAAKRKRHVLQLITKQKLEVQLDIADILEYLSQWKNPDKLTFIDANKNSAKDWNNLWKVPERKLIHIVNPKGNEAALHQIEEQVEDQFLTQLFAMVRKRILKDRLREEFEVQRRRNFEEQQSKEMAFPRSLEVVSKKYLLKNRSQKFLHQQRVSTSLAEPKIKRDHPENIGYDYSCYRGLLFDEELLPPEARHEFRKKHEVDFRGDGIYSKGVASHYLRRDLKKSQSCAQLRKTPHQPQHCAAVKEELRLFEERLHRVQSTIRVYDDHISTFS